MGECVFACLFVYHVVMLCAYDLVEENEFYLKSELPSICLDLKEQYNKEVM